MRDDLSTLASARMHFSTSSSAKTPTRIEAKPLRCLRLALGPGNRIRGLPAAFFPQRRTGDRALFPTMEYAFPRIDKRYC
jgi:hypothetical protein